MPISKGLNELVDNFKNSNKWNVTDFNANDEIWPADSVKEDIKLDTLPTVDIWIVMILI